jgi:hypothetical protein
MKCCLTATTEKKDYEIVWAASEYRLQVEERI